MSTVTGNNPHSQCLSIVTGNNPHSQSLSCYCQQPSLTITVLLLATTLTHDRCLLLQQPSVIITVLLLATTLIHDQCLLLQQLSLTITVLLLATTLTHNHCSKLADSGQSWLQSNTTGHREWENFTGFLSMEAVKMTSMMQNNLLTSWQLFNWSRNYLLLRNLITVMLTYLY
jgi:hypothetical protein